ncbi:ABC transporter ATP-binding protein [uncultured Roseibium sp.]|uniref:ABC transporter ATP-binding protein n=1 Tax=uncultured Roseibium sp. TaxID=1936171 RepID=UPI002636F96A|nr:ABC transporter ATP-binding protein [uncultured Roseibium sp.]
MLEVSNLGSGYGEVQVLYDLDFDIGNEVFAVLGANGAGKTTLLKTLAKLLPVRTGRMGWRGNDVTAVPPYELTAMGVAYVPQEGNVFPRLSVAENLSLGALVGTRPREERLDEIYALFPRLAERKDQAAGSLSGGEGQMLAVGRALMQEPEIILLDEPSAGLAPLYVDVLFETIAEARRTKGVTIVLAEQNAVKTLEIADRVLVLSLGRILMLKDAKQLSMKELMQAYHI